MTRRNELTRQIYNRKEKHKRSSLTVTVNDKRRIIRIIISERHQPVPISIPSFNVKTALRKGGRFCYAKKQNRIKTEKRAIQ